MILMKTGKAEENKRKKREALMHTAFELFSHEGIAHTSISDIAEKAGVGKGTFYFYFKDKYDLRNHIIAAKSGEIFIRAKNALDQTDLVLLEDKIIFLADNIISQLENDVITLRFVYKNLSWGVFESAFIEHRDTNIDFGLVFESAIRESEIKYENPLIMIYMIIELISSTCHDSILYGKPLPINEMKGYVFQSIRAIMRAQQISPEKI